MYKRILKLFLVEVFLKECVCVSCTTSEVVVKAFEEVVGKERSDLASALISIHRNFVGYFGHRPQGLWAGRELQEQH